MDILSIVFQKILYSSIAAVITILIILSVKRVLGLRLPIRLHHALWMIVLIRLLIPVAPQSPLSVFNLYSFREAFLANLNLERAADSSKENISIDNNLYEPQSADYSGKSDNTAAPNNIEFSQSDEKVLEKAHTSRDIFIRRLAYIWLTGILIILLTVLLEVFKFKLKMKSFRIIDDMKSIDLVRACCEKLNIKQQIFVYESEYFKGPCITGLLNPKIYLPKDTFNSIGERELTHILLHELAHYKRKDLILNVLAVTAATIHWFNPIVWFSISRMKLDRELACDAYVMEALRDGDNLDYGMTMLKLSKLFMNDKNKLSFASYYETKSHLERRIIMIKNFKKGAYKISFAAITCCAILAATTLTNAMGTTDAAQKSSTTVIMTQTDNIKKAENNILVDAPTKAFHDIKRAEEFAGFKFMVPDYVPSGYEVSGYQLKKASDKINVLKLYFENKENNKAGIKADGKENSKIWRDFSFYACSEDLTDALIKIESLGNYFAVDSKMNSIKGPTDEKGGFKFTVTGVNEKSNASFTDEYYVWKNNNIWYAVQYTHSWEMQGSKSKINYIELSQADIGKIAESITNLGETKSVNYLVFKPEISTEIGQLAIYDKKDLDQAKKMLSFKPKFPLTLPDGKKVDDAGVGIASDSDIQNNKINYDFIMFYYYKDGSLTFYQEKNINKYDDIKKNGYIAFDNKTMKEKRVKVGTSVINGKEVLVYKEAAQSENERAMTDYTWKENGFLCSATFFGTVEKHEEILKALVAEKSIE